MLINNIVCRENASEVTLSATVQFRGSKPETIYFTTPYKNKAFVSIDASPFLVALLLPCMKTREDIVIEGEVSAQLLKQTKQIMQLVAGWNIGLSPITITVARKSTVPQRSITKGGVACFFSGGVDSFYTYLQHKKEITDFILVHGFDIPLNNKQFFAEVQHTIEAIGRETNVHPLIVTTNVADVIEQRLVWDFAHGGALAAVGLFVGKELSTVYISGAVRDDELFPYGTHPALDHLWSTEQTSFIHDGTEANRLEKITKCIARSPLALHYLRVCTQNIKGSYNCGRCYKCLITMLNLVCANALENAKTFPHQIDLAAVSQMYYDYGLLYNQQGEVVLDLLQKQDREPELQKAIAESLEKSKHPGLSKRIMKWIAIFDQRYNDRRFYRWTFQMTNTEDRNWLFKFLLHNGLLK